MREVVHKEKIERKKEDWGNTAENNFAMEIIKLLLLPYAGIMVLVLVL